MQINYMFDHFNNARWPPKTLLMYTVFTCKAFYFLLIGLRAFSLKILVRRAK